MAEVFEVREFASPHGKPWCEARIKYGKRGIYKWIAFTVSQFGLSETELRARAQREANDIERGDRGD